MNVLVIGGGGREHALAWKLSQSPSVKSIIATPGNPGIAQHARLETGADPLAIAKAAGAALTIVGPEAPLAVGIVDQFQAAGLPIFGPTRAAAQIEASKAFAKELMDEAGIPTARFHVATDLSNALRALPRFELPVVIKADGLAAGKGVVIAKTRAQAEEAIRTMFEGDMGGPVVIEDFCPGEEVSLIAITDGETVLPLEPAQDHKAVFDGDRGPNTGGMGAYSDSRIINSIQSQQLTDTVLEPTLAAMARRGTPFCGFLYAGLMMTAHGPRVLEFNARLGDPETQPLMMRLQSDLLEPLQAAVEGQLSRVRLRWSPDPSVCVVLCAEGYPAAPAKGDAIVGIDAAEALGAVVFQAGTTIRDGELQTAGGRVLGVTATASTLRQAIDRSYDAAARIHFRGMHFRRDIGAKGLKRW